MPLKARNKNGEEVYSWELRDDEKSDKYLCCECEEDLDFVDANLKIKHFRHRVSTNCDPEPETPEHVFHKRLVFEKIKSLKIGRSYMEHKIGCQRSDVYWAKDSLKGGIAIEVQASSVEPSVFDEKIKKYAYRKDLVVVYFFVGDNFLKEIRDHVYALKEIEKRIFVTGHYKDTVLGAYLSEENVTVPLFKNKLARGHAGICSNRFIMDFRETKKLTLEEYLREMYHYYPTASYSPACPHEKIRHVKHNGLIVRYKVMCEDCGAFLYWLKNKIALSLGYSLERA